MKLVVIESPYAGEITSRPYQESLAAKSTVEFGECHVQLGNLICRGVARVDPES